MSEAAKKKAGYNDLYGIPENMTGEIINGELIVTPRPSPKHVYTASALDKKIGSPYQFGEGGGPGGWIILVEPEVKFGEDVVVPDLAGWKKERYPKTGETNWISITPDWACEVLSPGTLRVDRVKKMPLYSRYGVPHFWLVDPVAKILEVFRLESGRWSLLGAFSEDEKVRVEPFQEIEIDLSVLWLEGMA
ncbi:MAG: Uma2 family endonuclease [Syntrophobacteraceae bacterium]